MSLTHFQAHVQALPLMLCIDFMHFSAFSAEVFGLTILCDTAEVVIINGRGIVQYNFEATVDEELTVDRGEQVRSTSPWFPAVAASLAEHFPPALPPSPYSVSAHRPNLA